MCFKGIWCKSRTVPAAVSSAKVAINPLTRLGRDGNKGVSQNTCQWIQELLSGRTVQTFDMSHIMTTYWSTIACILLGGSLLHAQQPTQLMEAEVFANQQGSLAQAPVWLADSLWTSNQHQSQSAALWMGHDVRALSPGSSSTLSIHGLPSAYSRIQWMGADISSPDLGTTDLSLMPQMGHHIQALSSQSSRLGSNDGSSVGVQSVMEMGNSIQWDWGSMGYGQGLVTVHSKLQQSTFSATIGMRQWDHDYRYKNHLGETLSRLGDDGLRKSISTLSSRKLGNWQWDVGTFVLAMDRGLPESANSDYRRGARQEDFRAQFHQRQRLDLPSGSYLQFSQQAWTSEQWYQYPRYNISDSNWSRGASLALDLGRRLASHQWKVTSTVGFEGVSGLNKLDSSIATFRNHMSLSKTWSARWSSSLDVKWIHQVSGLSHASPKLSLRHDGQQAIHHWVLQDLYRMPTMNDLFWQPGGNMDLHPEKGWDLNYTFQRPMVAESSFRLEAFISHLRDGIVWIPVGGFQWEPRNVSELTRSGLSAEGIRKTKWGLMALSYQWVNARNSEGEQAPYVTPHKLRLSWTAPKQPWGVRLIAKSAMPTAWDGQTLTSYALLQLHREFAWKRMTMSFVLDNALSTNYSLQGGYPMPGRNIQVHIKQSLEPLKILKP